MNPNDKIILDYFKTNIGKSYPIDQLPSVLENSHYFAEVDEALDNTTTKEQFEILLAYAKWGLGMKEV